MMWPNAPVAQLDRVSASEAEGHRFESCQARHLCLFSFCLLILFIFVRLCGLG